jgi:hypothetical protein
MCKDGGEWWFMSCSYGSDSCIRHGIISSPLFHIFVPMLFRDCNPDAPQTQIYKMNKKTDGMLARFPLNPTPPITSPFPVQQADLSPPGQPPASLPRPSPLQ